MLQNQHRIDHGDALVSSPTPHISFFKPFQLFYYLNCGRVESIVENKHGEWTLMRGLVCFFSSHQVTFQSCYVRFTPFAIIFDFFFFWSNSFDCCSPTCPAIRRGNYNVYVSHPGPQIQENLCPPVPACLSTTSASELGPWSWPGCGQRGAGG